MKALTVLQPWAHAIIHRDKTVENRTWPTKHRGWLLIHSGKRNDPFQWDAYRTTIEWKMKRALQETNPTVHPDAVAYGAIIGAVYMFDCVPVREAAHSAWAVGPWCWMFDHVQTLAFDPVIPFIGRQGLFDVPADILPEWAQETIA